MKIFKITSMHPIGDRLVCSGENRTMSSHPFTAPEKAFPTSDAQVESVAIPQVRVGDPVRYKTLSVFPLFDGSMTPVEYTLSDEGIGSGAVSVEEVSEDGSVPDLLVENKGDVRVLFLEGEELVGAKQNRVLNTSVLIAAHSKTKIPVSCVERGRWGYKSRKFGCSGSHSSSKLRYFLKSSVSKSVLARRGHRSDQGKVWEEVQRQQSALGASSRTYAMSDTFQTHQGNVAEFQEELQYVDGACGLAVAIGKKVVAVDLFDKATTCRKVWQRLLSGYVLDALEADAAGSQGESDEAEAANVEQLLGMANAMPWHKADSVGEGDEYRANEGDDVHASALTLDHSPVHVSLVVAG